jgi:peptidoglycan/LPS O-acetylase OafA/YrhL
MGDRIHPHLSQSEPLLRPVMLELDSIRGIAILAVLFYHGLFWGIDLSSFSRTARLVLTGVWVGRLGVNLFFVLSGFLITGLLLDSKERSDYYSRFYKRRALRILPAYLLTIALLVLVSHTPWKFIVLSLLYLSNLTPLFGVPIAYPVLWSLAVEEHFYFVWPWVVRWLKVKHLAICCLLLVVMSPVSRAVSFLLTRTDGYVSFVCNEYTWNSIDGLACGALLAIWLRSSRPSRQKLLRVLSIICVVAVVVWIAGIPWGIWNRQRLLGAAMQVVPWHLFFVSFLGCSLLIGTSRWKGIVQWEPLRFFGEISYGLYLYHLLIFNWIDYLARRKSISWLGTRSVSTLLARFVLASTIAIVISFASRRLFENRFLKLKSGVNPRPVP